MRGREICRRSQSQHGLFDPMRQVPTQGTVGLLRCPIGVVRRHIWHSNAVPGSFIVRPSKMPRQANDVKGNSEMHKHLKRILYDELVAINQYFLRSKMFKEWELTELAEHHYQK